MYNKPKETVKTQLLMNNLAPIVLFVYKRFNHTKRTLESLSKNILADQSELYIFSDGPKTNADAQSIAEINQVQELISSQKWCKKVYIIKSKTNQGLANSIINGVTKVINEYGKIIVLEDDIMTSKYFLLYMNTCLTKYANNDKIMHISSYIPNIPFNKLSSEIFLLKFMSCWGWGTWKNSWEKLSTNVEELYQKLLPFKRDFNLSNSSNLFRQIEQNLDGTLYTWATKWYASIYLSEGLCIHPKYSLCQNIGIDGTGENFTNKKVDQAKNNFSTTIGHKIVTYDLDDIEENKYARKQYEHFFYQVKFNNLIFKIRQMLELILKKGTISFPK